MAFVDCEKRPITLAPLQLPTLLEHEWRALVSRFQGRRRLPAIVLIAIVVTLLALMCESSLGYVRSGGLLFKALFVPTTIILLFFARGLGVRLVEHRRNQMLGLVFLTGAKPRHLFLSQITARVLAAIYLALALLPCLMISILYGGASKERCIAAAIFIVVEVVFLIALEFLGPALTTDPAAAGLITIIATAILTLWPWALDRISLLLSGAAMPQWIYFFSPLSAFSQILRGFTNASEFRDFFLTCAIITTLSAAALLFSAWILSHTWREDDHPLLRFRAIRRLVQFARDSQRQWARILRPRIEVDPLLWYAAYDLRFVRYAWATVAITMVLWFAGFAAWGKAWLVPEVLYIAAATLIYGVRLQMILRAGMRISESRQNQYFDAILAAKQVPDLILDAEETAIFMQFNTVAWAVRALTVTFMVAPIPLRHWNGLTIAEHLALSGTLLWASALRPRMAIARTMWIALNTGTGVASVFRRSSFPLLQFGFQFYRIIQHGVANLAKFPTGQFLEALLVLIGCPVIILIATSANSEHRALQVKTARYFREIIQAPLRSAKEIAKWDTKEPLL